MKPYRIIWCSGASSDEAVMQVQPLVNEIAVKGYKLKTLHFLHVPNEGFKLLIIMEKPISPTT